MWLNMVNKKLIEEKLKKYNQEHILEEMKEMNNEQKNILFEQIDKIDFEKMKKLYNTVHKVEENEKITPIESINKKNLKDIETIEQKGIDIIKNDEYAVITMAGGQGTRLGFDGPKGTFKLDIGKSGKYIFEILAETLKQSKIKYGILPYWYIMTSKQNDDKTKSFFEEHNFFGYDKGKVKFFKQNVLPQLTLERKISFRKWNYKNSF